MNNLYVRVRVVVLAMLACLLAICLGTVAIILQPIRVNGESQTERQQTYYYDQLNPDAKLFYKAINDMATDGTFKDGKSEYDLVANNIVTASQLSSYSQNSEVMTAFGAARDAYSLDHPELFYIDLSRLSLSVGTKADGSYSAYLGTGRADNYYLEGGFSSASAVDTAISAFNTQVRSITTEAKRLSSAEEQIAYVNTYLVDNVTYTFIPAEESDGSYIHNPYGALLNGSAVCEGFSRAFKVIMDELDIPCVLVQGYADSAGDGSSWQAHMWNYVEIANKWYAVDSTWDNTLAHSTNAPASAKVTYFLKGSSSFFTDHKPDGVVSAVNYEFSYPALYAYDFGENSQFSYEFTKDGNTVTIQFSYMNKSLDTLESEGKYFAWRTTDTTGTTWTNWGQISVYAPEDRGTYSVVSNVGTSFKYLQFAIMDAPAADGAEYTADEVAAHTVATSAQIENGTNGTYIAPPFPISMTPSNSKSLSPEETYDITITYDEDLVKVKGATVGIKILNSNGDDLTIGTNKAKISHFSWSKKEPNKISFTLQPSLMYGDTEYLIYVEGLVGKDSQVSPNPASYRFWRKSTVCSKVFNDGRLWLNVYGTPSLVAESNLAEEDSWSSIPANQRSQLMLVVNTPEQTDSDKMIEMMEEESGISASAVKSSATYDIDLLMCGKVQSIPEGSYMQVGFGFPEGYGPDSAGVTFQVYHYKKDADGNIISVEPVECVITEYGIIAKVSSFSPYAVVAVKKSAVTTTTKGVYARTVGLGGDVTGGLQTIASGNSATYTLTPENGYKVDRVLLNGTVLSADKYADNTLTLSYAELSDNNMIEVSYVAESALAKDADRGITIVYPNLKIAAEPTSQKIAIDSGLPAWAIILIVVGAVLLVAAAVVWFLFWRQRKAATAKAGANTVNRNSATKTIGTKKPTAKTATTSTTAKTTAKPATTAKTTAKPATTAKTAAKPATTATKATKTTKTTKPNARSDKK